MGPWARFLPPPGAILTAAPQASCGSCREADRQNRWGGRLHREPWLASMVCPLSCPEGVGTRELRILAAPPHALGLPPSRAARGLRLPELGPGPSETEARVLHSGRRPGAQGGAGAGAAVGLPPPALPPRGLGRADVPWGPAPSSVQGRPVRPGPGGRTPRTTDKRHSLASYPSGGCRAETGKLRDEAHVGKLVPLRPPPCQGPSSQSGILGWETLSCHNSRDLLGRVYWWLVLGKTENVWLSKLICLFSQDATYTYKDR